MSLRRHLRKYSAVHFGTIMCILVRIVIFLTSFLYSFILTPNSLSRRWKKMWIWDFQPCLYAESGCIPTHLRVSCALMLKILMVLPQEVWEIYKADSMVHLLRLIPALKSHSSSTVLLFGRTKKTQQHWVCVPKRVHLCCMLHLWWGRFCRKRMGCNWWKIHTILFSSVSKFSFITLSFIYHWHNLFVCISSSNK